MQHRSRVFPLMLATVALATVACSSSPSSSSRSYTEGVIDRPGQTLVRYRGPEIEVVVSTRHAVERIGDPWLILPVGIGGTVSATTEVRRDKVTLRTPQGQRLGLMPHREFSGRYSEIAVAARQAVIAAEPLDFTRSSRAECSLSFMPLPGTDVVNEAVHVNHRRMCQGLLYFNLSEGVQPGPYRLVVELEERRIEVPFDIR